jgi:hypothetical protein
MIEAFILTGFSGWEKRGGWKEGVGWKLLYGLFLKECNWIRDSKMSVKERGEVSLGEKKEKKRRGKADGWKIYTQPKIRPLSPMRPMSRPSD